MICFDHQNVKGTAALAQTQGRDTCIRPQLDIQPREEPPHESADLHNALQATEIWGLWFFTALQQQTLTNTAIIREGTLLPHHSGLYLLCVMNRAFDHSTLEKFSTTKLHDNEYNWTYILLINPLCISIILINTMLKLSLILIIRGQELKY